MLIEVFRVGFTRTKALTCLLMIGWGNDRYLLTRRRDEQPLVIPRDSL